MAHARAEYPRECCGVVAQKSRVERYFPCRNLADNPTEQFHLAPEDYVAAAEWGTITLIVHSHPDATTQPSELDKAQCDAMELPWAIASWPEGDLRTLLPRGELPLVGRQFVLGHTDCWGLVMSYYRQEHGLALPDYRADYPWWERGENRYLDNWHACGFASLAARRSQEIWRSCRFRRRWPTTPAFCWQMACCCTICTACSASGCLTAVTGRSER